ncbi:hypothetical protein ACIQJT_37875 [Streptomyces sp. NPDC091972]|uniref:hypothetical protein n=1 Tax=Streptomyces sp. NPDC091972 TaxID=3366007 RepID=UPI00382E46F3
MAIGTTAGLSNGITIALTVVLAFIFIFGYALTARGVRRTGLPWPQPIRIAR